MHTFKLLLLALIFCACQKDHPEPNPADASRIEGTWVNMTQATDWSYHFQSGLLTQQYTTAGVVITELSYPYAVRDSIVIIGGDLNNAPREWVVFFQCNEVVEITAQNGMIAQRFWLKRE
jgi:hypothetical protein